MHSTAKFLQRRMFPGSVPGVFRITVASFGRSASLVRVCLLGDLHCRTGIINTILLSAVSMFTQIDTPPSLSIPIAVGHLDEGVVLVWMVSIQAVVFSTTYDILQVVVILQWSFRCCSELLSLSEGNRKKHERFSYSWKSSRVCLSQKPRGSRLRSNRHDSFLRSWGVGFSIDFLRATSRITSTPYGAASDLGTCRYARSSVLLLVSHSIVT